MELIKYAKFLFRKLAAKNPNSNSKSSVISIDVEHSIGNCLVSYLTKYIYSSDYEINHGHSSKWESKKIVNIFSSLGYNVDVINFDNETFIPQKKYDIIFDIHYNIARLSPYLTKDAVKILHSTGSYTSYAASRELDRVEKLIQRKKKPYSPKRICDTVYFKRSADIANYISLFGTKHTISTFPLRNQNKITLLPVTYSNTIKKDLNSSLGNEYLWFYGGGAVHKGLDILLDIFSVDSRYTLNIVGNIEHEKDFMNIYYDELSQKDNILYHGYLDPLSSNFKKIVQRCKFFIAPSCSESTSTAAVTCLIAGLYPIYSIDNGLELPVNTGYLLKDCSHKEIIKGIKLVSSFSDQKIIDEVKEIQKFIFKKHSRENFTNKMYKFIEGAIGK